MPKPDLDLGDDDESIDDLLGGESSFDDVDKESPLDALKPTGSLEGDCDAEMSATLKAFRENRANEAKIFEDTTDSEYWFCVCFQNRAQKDAFLAAMKWAKIGDKYLDGLRVAKAQGVALPEANPRFIEKDTDKRTMGLGCIAKPSA
jgi:hypothetical protein